MIITPSINRVDTLAAATGVDPQDIVRWNLRYFVEHRTLWLPVGDDFVTVRPAGQSGFDILVNDNRLLADGRVLQIDGG